MSFGVWAQVSQGPGHCLEWEVERVPVCWVLVASRIGAPRWVPVIAKMV